MGRSILQAVAAILLCLLPFAGVLMRFAPSTGQYSFAEFLVASLIFISFLFVLGCFVAKGLPHQSPGKMPPATWLFLLAGLIFTIPLNMNAPPFDPGAWLATAAQQQTRFSLLLAAYLVFLAGITGFVWNRRKELPVSLTVLLIAFALYSVVAGVGDCMDALSISGQINDWTTKGNPVEEFFLQYKPSNIFGMTDRAGFYVTTIVLCIAAAYLKLINIWALLFLSVFCLTGIIVSVLFLRSGNPDYYFPFMVPAVALAPAYWLGVVGLKKS